MEIRERKAYLDILRIVAAVFVVGIHVVKLGANESAGADRAVLIAIHTLVRSAVPLFLMISGALWLDPKREVKPRRVARGVARLVCAFVFWSAVYAVVQTVLLEGKGIKAAVVSFVTGADHMWFIYMMLCMYLLVPILRKVAENRAVVGYFVLLSLFFTFTLPIVTGKLSSDVVNAVNEKTHFYFTLGYVPYFMLGQYLASGEIKRPARCVIYALGLAAFVATVILTVRLELPERQFVTFRINPSHPFVLLQAAAIFTFARYALSKISFRDRTRRALCAVSARTFGVYLVHPLVIEALHRLSGFDMNTLPAALSAPLFITAVFAVSFGVSAIFSLIPVVKKYIV